MSTRRRNAATAASAQDGAVAAAGAGYVATTKLFSKRDANGQRTIFAAPGETCERVPETSLPWLREQGLIVPAPTPAEE